MNEEEYDRWLAESLDEALTLLRRKAAEASPSMRSRPGRRPGRTTDAPT